MKKQHNIVLIGGGTGTSVVVNGLKEHPVNITSVVSVADSGGSTGRLRDEFGFQPVGDLRQSLASLARDDSQDWIRKLLLYRFENGNGLKGHNVGNLILIALQDMAGSTARALELAQKIFRIEGTIYPVTTTNVDLVIEYADGRVVVGEHLLDEYQTKNPQPIVKVGLSPRAHIYNKARKALKEADLIVIGPGDYYASLMAALSVIGMSNAIKNSKGKVVYISNLMTRITQTHGMTAQDHVKGIAEIIGKELDYTILNSDQIDKKILRAYAADQEYPVIDDLPRNKQVIRRKIAQNVPYEQNKNDKVKRSLLRHDSQKLAKVLIDLL